MVTVTKWGPVVIEFILNFSSVEIELAKMCLVISHMFM